MGTVLSIGERKKGVRVVDSMIKWTAKIGHLVWPLHMGLVKKYSLHLCGP